MKVKIVNVFSINNQGGNPCAIVANASHLSTDEMQAMATRLNLPETVFITIYLDFLLPKENFLYAAMVLWAQPIIFLNPIYQNLFILNLIKLKLILI
jgi:hypothetical protein